MVALALGAVAAIGAYALVANARAHPATPASIAAELPYRYAEPRLSGAAPYRPYRPPPLTSRESTPAWLRLRAAASEVLGHPSSHSERDVAAAQLILGNAAAAVERLEGASAHSQEAWLASDLAAALLVRAQQLDDGDLAVAALTAADRALARDPHSAPAAFNRPLALERLGLIDESRRAWLRYLELDPSSGWSDEARHRLSRLRAGNEIAEWNRLFASLQRAPAAGREAMIRSAVSRFPQQARQWGESLVLSAWADATLAGDATRARESLELARGIGGALAARSGERLLHDAVLAIDRASVGGTVTELARGQVSYRDGRLAHKADRPAEAETRFAAAGQISARYGSPMANLARYYRGSALHAQTRLGEASAVLDALAREDLAAHGYRAAAAQLGWELGACQLERGSIAEAIATFTRSREAFEALGERDLAAMMDSFVAVALDCTGDRAEAWRARRRALEGLERSGNAARAMVVLESAAAAVALDHEWSRAESLLRLTIETSERMGNVPLAAHAYSQRALVRVEQGRTNGALHDLEASRRWIARIGDARVRERAEADLAFAEAMARKVSAPAEAVRRFTDALSFFERAGRSVEVPRIHLERARAERSLGRREEARADLGEGIAALEKERGQLRQFEQRASLLATAEALFDEAIDLALESGDTRGAFTFAERRRARALREMYELGTEGREIAPMPLETIEASLAPDAAIVVWSALPTKLAAFVIRSGRLAVVTQPLRRAESERAIAAFCRAIDRQENELAAAAEAGAMLLQPLRAELAGSRRIAMIPDRTLSGVPFAALYDATRGRFLIEDAVVLEAPSATLLIRASMRAAAATPASLLAVGGTVAGFDVVPLAMAGDEARRVASLYRRADVMVGREATRANVLASLPHYDAVHFATHAVSDPDRISKSALLLAPAANDRGELRLGDIAALRLSGVDIAVLAACRSAAKTRRSDGPGNLALAFLAAGVPTVVASVFDLDDSGSAALMESLHGELRNGIDPATAARDAVLPAIRDARGRIRVPMEWPNITVVGGSDAMVRKNGRGGNV